MRFSSLFTCQTLVVAAMVGIASAGNHARAAEGAMVQMAYKRQLLDPITGDSSAGPTDAPTGSDDPPSNTPTPTPASSTPPPSSSPTPTPKTTPPPPSSAPPSSKDQPAEETFITKYVTVSDGKSYTVERTSKGRAPAPTSTKAPSVNKGNGGDESSMAPKTKALIGGLVGGIGGALFLGGIAVVIWRLRARRQNQYLNDEDDLGHSPTDPLTHKEGRGAGHSPFKNTLDQYHTPSGRPNASSNF